MALQGEDAWWVWACSHGGTVVCVHGPSGETLWRLHLQGRAQMGASLTRDLQVPIPLLYIVQHSTCTLQMYSAGT